MRRVDRGAWSLFRAHHYLNTSLVNSARCWCAFWGDRPVAFASVVPHPGVQGAWREHRTVCLPDFQGVGIGNAISEFVGSVVTALFPRYVSVTGNPAMIHYRHRSSTWRMIRKPSLIDIPPARAFEKNSASFDRLTATFAYVGPRADRGLARRMWDGL